MPNKKANYLYLREAFLVKRYHTVGHIHEPETVGHHTCNVIALLFHMYDDIPPIYMVKHALHHDAPELATGDAPATAKWAHDDLAKAHRRIERWIIDQHGLSTQNLSDKEISIMKYVDMMDLCFKCVEEIVAGNLLFRLIFQRGLLIIRELLNTTLRDHEPAIELYVMLESNPFVSLGEIDVPAFKAPGTATH